MNLYIKKVNITHFGVEQKGTNSLLMSFYLDSTNHKQVKITVTNNYFNQIMEELQNSDEYLLIKGRPISLIE